MVAGHKSRHFFLVPKKGLRESRNFRTAKNVYSTMFLHATKGVCAMNMGIRIQTLLDEKGLSRREFARRLNINYSTVTGYLKDRRLPDCETLLKMSILLNTSTDYLIGRTTIRHHRDLYYTEKEGVLVSNFRNLSPDMQQVLINISSCLRFTPHKERTFWKQD